MPVGLGLVGIDVWRLGLARCSDQLTPGSRELPGLCELKADIRSADFWLPVPVEMSAGRAAERAESALFGQRRTQG